MSIIIFSLLYLLAFLALIFTTLNQKYLKYRIITKSITSLLFVLLYILINGLNGLMLIGLILCFLGDFFLAFTKNNHKTFMIQGLLSFLLAHLVYVSILSSIKGINVLNLCAAFIALLVIVILCHKLNIDLKNKAGSIYLYSFVIFLMGFKAIEVIFHYFNYHNLLFGIGAILFIISDFVLLLLYFKYKKNQKLQIANSCLYYLAQYLMVISYLF